MPIQKLEIEVAVREGHVAKIVKTGHVSDSTYQVLINIEPEWKYREAVLPKDFGKVCEFWNAVDQEWVLGRIGGFTKCQRWINTNPSGDSLFAEARIKVTEAAE